MKGLGVGRIVHFVLWAGDIRPAIVTRVVDADKGLVGLHVFLDANDPPGIPYDESLGEPGLSRFDDSNNPVAMTWHWPPRA